MKLHLAGESSFQAERPARADGPADTCRLPWSGVVAWSIVFVSFLFVGVFDHDIWAPTEPAVSGAVWNMLAHGELAVPRVNEMAYLEKPPMYYWLAYLACRLGGSMSPGLIRLPAAILGLASLALIYSAIRRRMGETPALVTLLVAATSFMFFEIFHRASTDTLAIFFCFACFTAFSQTLSSGMSRRRILATDLVFSLLLAASFYSKIFFTFLIVLPPVIVTLALLKRWSRLLTVCVATFCLTILLVIPWAISLYQLGGWDYIRLVFVDNSIGRFFSLGVPGVAGPGIFNDAMVAEHGKPWLFYAEPLVVAALPWIFLAGAGIGRVFTRRPADEFIVFIRSGLLSIPLVLSISAVKVFEYIIPISFFYLLATAVFVADQFTHARQPSRWARTLLLCNVGLFVLGLSGVPVLLAHRENDWILALAAVPMAVAAAISFFVLFRSRFSPPGICASFTAIAILPVIALMVAVPVINEVKTCRHFFAGINHLLPGRRLYTTIRNDRELPLANYYLESRLTTIQFSELRSILASDPAAAVLIKSSDVARARECISGAEFSIITTTLGKNAFAFVTRLSRRQARRDSVSAR
ncbi:MAG: hypothetical protein C0404_00990 [Verrucomicrobia bacterium]|nr:hypothetical protein [Verrucomicrobiota bacterium]